MITKELKPSQHRANPKNQQTMFSFKRSSKTDDSDTYLLTEAQKSIQVLFKMRFIEVICRPIQKIKKEEYVEKFAGRMQNLHNILNKIRNQIVNKQNSIKEQSGVEITEIQPYTLKRCIRNIETRYSEVFYEGNFKLYPKLYVLNNFSFDLQRINIQQWATDCLNPQIPKKEICC